MIIKKLLTLIFAMGISYTAYAGSAKNCTPKWVDITSCLSQGKKIFLRYNKATYYQSSFDHQIYVACGKRYNNSIPLRINDQEVWFRVEGIDVLKDNVAFIVDVPPGSKTLAAAKIKALVRRAGTRVIVPCKWEYSEEAKNCVLACKQEKKTNP